MSPREVMLFDPQQRLLLEVTWEALEHAGINPLSLAGTETGVFVGIYSSDYIFLQIKQHLYDSLYNLTGNSHAAASGRISYFLDCRGPSFSVDTASSASLAAFHLACQSLWNNECPLALAAGVNLILSSETSQAFSNSGMLSEEHRCKSFDASANGYARSEGCGVVVIKRLSDAIAAHDNVLAVVRGSAMNQDGATISLTVPNGSAQEAVIRKALSVAHLEPGAISYVEAHGSGTPVGDPIEGQAIRNVYGDNQGENQEINRKTPLVVGSVKTNLGHLEAAAGIAGIIKTVLSLKHGHIPPHLHFRELPPQLNGWPVIIPTTGLAWERSSDNEPRRAGVSGFGFSGTNIHVILEEAPNSMLKSTDAIPESLYQLLTLSAKNEAALHALAERYAGQCATNPDQSLSDICFTSHVGRAHFDHRLALVADSTEQLREELFAFTTGQETLATTSQQVSRNSSPKIAFLFTGQGSQYLNMGRELYETQPVFRQTIVQCDAVLQECLGRSLLELIYPTAEPEHNDLMASHTCGQVVNFAVECALADLWRSWGVMPDVVFGHSLGDFTAAYTAGVLTLEDGLRLVTIRGKLMEQGQGRMVVVNASEAEVSPFVAPYDDVVIGVINGPDNVVISGEREHTIFVARCLNEAGFSTNQLQIPMAAHSPMLDGILDEFESEVSAIVLAEPRMTVVSSMTGQPVVPELTDPSYWRRHLRNQVRFADGMNTLQRLGVDVFIEIGPKPSLLGMGRLCLPEWGAWLPSLQPNFSDAQTILQSVAELYVRGVSIDWPCFEQFRRHQRKRVVLPTYPFQRQHFWLPAVATGGQVDQSTPDKQDSCISALDTCQPVFDRITPQPSLLVRMAQATPPRQKELLIQFLQNKIRHILRVGSKHSISFRSSFKELGFDSLMLTELNTLIEQELKIKSPLERLVRLGNFESLTKMLLKKITLPPPEPEIPSEEQHPCKPLESTDLNRTQPFEQSSELIDFHQASSEIPQIHAIVSEQQGRKLRIGEKWVFDFASCNYLGLDLHPEVMKVIPPALEKWGVHPSWTRAVASPAIYEELEQSLAALVEAPSVLVFPAVTLLHAGVLPVLAGEDGVIFKDIFAHRSILEGCQLAQAGGAELIEFRHNNVGDLEEKLKRCPLERTKIIAIDGVYSMSGAYPPLPEYARLARTYNAYVYLDDAHGIGLVGENPTPDMPYGAKGNGMVKHFGLDYLNDHMIYVAGLSKSFSSFGAFVTCTDEAMKNRFRSASTFIFSGPSPVASLASALAGIRLNTLEGDVWRKQVYQLTSRLVNESRKLGFEVVNENYFPIVGVVIGQTQQVIEACNILWEFGILITPAIFPIVPMDRGLLRFSITAANTEEEIDRALASLQAVRERLKL
jgi:acyl transferase domain-containing protein/7-keto-8-aminopelargonate synthetase-like enzyme